MRQRDREQTVLERLVEGRIWRSIVRHGWPNNDLDRMLAMFSNFFLHLLPAKVHPHSLRPGYSLGLGFISVFLFLILVVTGVLLMFFYVPSVERAYADMKDLEFVVSFGVFLRNMHRWAAHGMVAAVFLHMCRVFYTGSYKPPREFNWVLGMLLLVSTFLLSFTGYLLPWDQLAFWAITVGSSIASYPPLIGDYVRLLLLGGNTVGQGALLRFYVLHVVVLPITTSLLLAIHVWRVRKDGGLSRPLGAPIPQIAGGAPLALVPEKTYVLVELAQGRSPTVGYQAPEEELSSWPHLVYRLILLFQATLLLVMLMGILVDAPLEELANPTRPPNPAKAPWYFLGLQELVSYSALVGGFLVPTFAVLGLMAIPYIDTEKTGEGIWFSSPRGRRVALLASFATIPLVLGLIAFNERFAVRTWAPVAPQVVVDILNPATILLIVMAMHSFLTWKISGSRRLGAIALFSSFLAAFVVLTFVGTFFRGPNWVWVWPWQAVAH